MDLLRPALAFAVVIAAGLAPAGSAAQAPRDVATVSRPTPITASSSGALWSRYDETAGHYVLTFWDRAAAPRSLAVQPRRVPFDADLTQVGGRPVAWYSRCVVEPQFRFTTTPVWATGRRCVLRRLDLVSGSETAVPGSHRVGASEVLPAVAGGRLWFFRVIPGRRQATLMTVALSGGRPRAVTTVPVRGREDGPVAVDAAADRVAFVARREVGGGEGDVMSLVVASAARRRTIATAVTSNMVGRTLLSPVLSRTSISYGHSQLSEGARSEIVTRTIAGRPVSTVAAPRFLLGLGGPASARLTLEGQSSAVAGPEGACSSETGGGACRIVAR